MRRGMGEHGEHQRIPDGFEWSDHHGWKLKLLVTASQILLSNPICARLMDFSVKGCVQ